MRGGKHIAFAGGVLSLLVLGAVVAAVRGGWMEGPGREGGGRLSGGDEGERSGGLPVFIGSGRGMELHLCVAREGAAAEDADATVDFEETVQLGVVVRKGGVFYTDLDEIVMAGKPVAGERTRGMAELPGWKRIRWYKIESGASSYMNSNRNQGWWASMSYVETADAVGRETVREADVRPLCLDGVTWRGRPVGTMRYKVAVEFEGFVLATPGKEAVVKGGNCPGVRRVSRKGGTGRPAVDAAMSLANLPYIWGSAALGGSNGAAVHQAERYIGADCTDLVVASWRMAGLSSLEYTAALLLLDRFASSVFGVEIAKKIDGVWYDGTGKPVAVGEGGAVPGAAVLWRLGRNKGHAALLAEDAGPLGEPNGVLDESDRVIHAIWDTPSLVRLGDVLPGLDPAAVVNPVSAQEAGR